MRHNQGGVGRSLAFIFWFLTNRSIALRFILTLRCMGSCFKKFTSIMLKITNEIDLVDPTRTSAEIIANDCLLNPDEL